MRDFLNTETGGAALMLAATVVALLWANIATASYESTWTTVMSIRIGGAGVTLDLRHWINEGLMTLFFLVVGLEAKRELDLGELRERRRIVLPAVAAVGGVLVPIAIYLAFNAGGSGGHGWGAAMSTDTAFALGVLALLTPRAATRMRVFLLTLAVFDDLAALGVIAIVYTSHVSGHGPRRPRSRCSSLLLALRYLPVGRTAASVVVAVALWVAMLKSGIDPLVSGLAVGLVTSAYPPERGRPRAGERARAFVPRAAHARAREVGAAGGGRFDLGQRAHAVRAAPLGQLRRAAPVRARQRRRAHHRRPARRGDRIAGLLRHRGRLRASASRSGSSLGNWLASRPALHGPRPLISGPILFAAGHLRRDRLHRLAADLEPRLHAA